MNGFRVAACCLPCVWYFCLSLSSMAPRFVPPGPPVLLSPSSVLPFLSPLLSFVLPRGRVLSLSCPLLPPLPSCSLPSLPLPLREPGVSPAHIGYARPGCALHALVMHIVSSSSLSLSLSLSLPPSFLPSSFPSSPFLPLFSLRGCARCPARFVLVLRLDIYTYIPMYIYTYV